jgi:UDP-N-acetylglucosamine:LPS N-acetylglucosamine transferase
MNVLMLTAGTGFGHLSVARAMADAIAEVGMPGQRVTIAAPLGERMDRAYGWMITRAPDLWGSCYAASSSAAGAAMGRRLLWLRFGGQFSRLVSEMRPSIIVSVHALCTQIASEYRRASGCDIPLYCVVTDLFDIHRLWAAPAVASYLVATSAAAERLVRLGISEKRVIVTGLPLRRPFWTKRMAGYVEVPVRGIAGETAHDGRLRVLVMDGGMPGPQLVTVVKTLRDAGVPLDIAVAWGRKAPPTHTLEVVGAHACTVCNLGRGDCMQTAMRAADIIVTKAGSLSVAEALAVGRPVLIHRALAGQEESNPSFVERIGAGITTPTRKSLIDAVRRLSLNPRLRDAMSRKARLYGRPDAALDAACHIAGVSRIDAATRPA